MKSSSKLPQNRKYTETSEARKWLKAGILGAVFVAAIGAMMTGCKGNVPAASVYPIASCPTPILLDGFEGLTTGIASNSTTFYVSSAGTTLNDWDNSDKDAPFTSVMSLSNFYATQGVHSLDVDIITQSSYDQHWLQLTGFTQNNWSNVSKLQADFTVDPSVVAGASYGSMIIINYSDSHGEYFRSISGDSPSLNAGFQTLTWNIEFTGGTASLNPTDPISRLYFVYNRSAPSGPGQGLGNIYVDNIRLVQNCP